MKKLTIAADNCLVSKDFVGVNINGKNLTDIIISNLPTMKEYKDYPGRVSITIELMDTDLNIEKEGYISKETAPDVQGVPDMKDIPAEKEAF